MRRLLLSTLTLLMVLGVAGQAFGYGEPVNSFPSWYERIIHVLTNRVRSDPQGFLTRCTDAQCPDRACYDGPRPPVFWDERLNRAARFHADHLVATGVGMKHDSPCDLSPSIGSTYPDTCDGATECACLNGSLSCAGTCPRFSDRVSLFGVSTWAENIAWRGDPYSILDTWVLEDGSDPSCQWTYDKGHRWSILNPQLTTLGVGGSSSYTVQDFGSGMVDQKIPAGAHYPETGSSITFLANWYDGQAPSLATVNVGGTCTPMAVEFGSDTNGTFAVTQTVSGCTQFYFLFKDANGTEIHYPSVGSFGVGCTEEWFATTPPAGAGCSCTPSCDGKVCGDNGCGGSCGDCGVGQVCDTGQCACAFAVCGGACCAETEVCAGGACCQPTCDGVVCGSDGCGGSCGTCGAGQTCDAGACVCADGFADCGAGCVSLGEPAHCGACEVACAAGEVCSEGVCATQCPAHLTDCGGACVDTATNSAHCSACFTPCGADETCEAAQCTPAGGEDVTQPDAVEGDAAADTTTTQDTAPLSDTAGNDTGSADTGSRELVSNGCGCQISAPGAGAASWLAPLFAALAVLGARRRRR